jgi:8-oxo-dGTP diphosphatase
MKKRVRAIIIKENKILIIKRTKSDDVYFVIPGGGVEIGENIETAIKRECKEELGVKIVVKNLFA